MFAQKHYPQSISGKELDRYLEKGWFRMGQSIFTTNFLNFKNQFYSAIWLRVKLDEFTPDTRLQRLLKLNRHFRTEIKPASITPEKEALYARYKLGVSFTASASLNELLFGGTLHNIYNTFEVNVYDNDRLIGAGFFDFGSSSAAGIISFYDPDFKKYSLGRYLIYQKMLYCQQLGYKFFYPGYFVPGYSFFNYKLDIGRAALEYLQFTTEMWIPIGAFSEHETPLNMMYEKLYYLQHCLAHQHIDSRVLKYEFFEGNIYPSIPWNDLLDFPVILVWQSHDGHDGEMVVVFDVRDERYHLIKCFSVWMPNAPDETDQMYSSHLLKTEYDLYATDRAEDMVKALSIPLRKII